MKKFINTSYDTIIETEIFCKHENNKPVKNEIGLFLHKESVRQIYMYVPIYDQSNGAVLGNTKICLSRQDIERINNEIKNTDTIEHFFTTIEDNLPW